MKTPLCNFARPRLPTVISVYTPTYLASATACVELKQEVTKSIWELMNSLCGKNIVAVNAVTEEQQARRVHTWVRVTPINDSLPTAVR